MSKLQALTVLTLFQYAFFMILVTEFYSVALGQAIGALSPSIFIASTINPYANPITLPANGA